MRARADRHRHVAFVEYVDTCWHEAIVRLIVATRAIIWGWRIPHKTSKTLTKRLDGVAGQTPEGTREERSGAFPALVVGGVPEWGQLGGCKHDPHQAMV